MKKRLGTAPRFVGEAIARVPYSARPGFASQYVDAASRRRRFDEQASTEEKRDYIFAHIKRIVDHAYANVPFYRRYYAEAGYCPAELRSFDDIAKIPTVSKDVLRGFGVESRSYKVAGRSVTYTGGSTGEPFKFYSDARQVGNEWAHMHAIWGTLGYKQSDLLLGVALDETRAPVYYDGMRHTLVLNVHYPRETLVDAFLKIPARKRRAKYFRGYPSAIAEFLSYCEKDAPEVVDFLRENLRGSFLASEFPLPIYRKTIERVTDKPTVSWYGHAERAILAWEKTKPYLYEPFQSYGYCETTTDDSGFTSLVGTAYWNFASPLIRYKTNDGVKVVREEDGILGAFEISDGRIGDYIVDKNGERFSITHLNLSCRESTWALAQTVQVEQREPGKIILWTTPRTGGKCDVEVLRKAFDFGALNLETEFRIVERPFRASNGKVLLKISTQEP